MNRPLLSHRTPLPQRRNPRLPNYDYAQAGAYFVTVVTANRELLFEEERARRIVEETWRWLAAQYSYVSLDEFIVMPNHLHGIIVLDDTSAGGSRTAPTTRKPLGGLIGAFKTVSTKQINVLRDSSGAPVWQRNFYEHIIRTDADLNRIREYIVNNPLQWNDDPENPNR